MIDATKDRHMLINVCTFSVTQNRYEKTRQNVNTKSMEAPMIHDDI